MVLLLLVIFSALGRLVVWYFGFGGLVLFCVLLGLVYFVAFGCFVACGGLFDFFRCRLLWIGGLGLFRLLCGCFGVLCWLSLVLSFVFWCILVPTLAGFVFYCCEAVWFVWVVCCCGSFVLFAFWFCCFVLAWLVFCCRCGWVFGLGERSRMARRGCLFCGRFAVCVDLMIWFLCLWVFGFWFGLFARLLCLCWHANFGLL